MNHETMDDFVSETDYTKILYYHTKTNTLQRNEAKRHHQKKKKKRKKVWLEEFLSTGIELEYEW